MTPRTVRKPPSTTGTGSKPVMVGFGWGVPPKDCVAVTVPPRVLTLMLAPVLTPLRIIARILRPSALTTNVAVVFPKRTAVAPVKFVPDISTICPADPTEGEKPVMEGGAIIVRALPDKALPPRVWMRMKPEPVVPPAPAGTVSVILVEEVRI